MEALICLRRSRSCGMAGYLEKLVEWADLCHATANLTRARLSPHRMPTKSPNLAEEEEFLVRLNAQWGAEFPAEPVLILEGMDQITAKLFHRVRQLSTLANLMGSPVHDPELQQQYTRGLLLLERQVNASIWSLNLNNLRQNGSATRCRGPISVRTCARTWHCTTLIYIYMALKETPKSSQILEKLVRRYKYSLQLLTPEELWIHFPPQYLLWSLVMASIASADHADRWWLLRLLKQLSQKLSLDSWDAARDILIQFAWVEHKCTRPGRLIWEESDTIEL